MHCVAKLDEGVDFTTSHPILLGYFSLLYIYILDCITLQLGWVYSSFH